MPPESADGNSPRAATAAVTHAGGERTVALVDGATVRLQRLDEDGNVLRHADVHTDPVQGELTTTMATVGALTPPPPGEAQLRVSGETVTLVVRTRTGDVLVCRLAYAPCHGYRVLRRTRIRPGH